MSRKRLLVISIAGSFVFLVVFFSNIRLILYYSDGVVNYYLLNTSIKEKSKPSKSNYWKYILLWTNPNAFPFIYFGEGNTIFKQRKCTWNNCYVTSDRNILRSYTNFDVIVFNGPQLTNNLVVGDLPKTRSQYQKYVYANIEAASNYPICTNVWDRYFNWTWTYKLNSDAVWGYMVVKNAKDQVVAPSRNIRWLPIRDMAPTSEDLKEKLNSKTKTAAWFVSNCVTESQREEYITELLRYLKEYDLDVDIFGECGNFKCPREIMERCLNMLERDYYFYFAFENALTEDYVTEKILYAVNHNTVPIVFGGADYNRFMPPGSYINAMELSPAKLAKKIYFLVHNKTEYYEMFKWKKYYSFHFRHESPNTDDYCNFCAMINNSTLMNITSIYDNLNLWWSEKKDCIVLKELDNKLPWENFQ